jgi:hypothetical protein
MTGKRFIMAKLPSTITTNYDGLTNTKIYFYNGKIVGCFAFYDDGGQYGQPLENSSKWHFGYGGGLILISLLTGPKC